MAKKNRKLKIGMLKAMPGKWDVDGNWAIFEQEFKRHRGDDLDVFITPECFLDGYAVTEKNWTLRKFTRVAQKMDDSPYIRRVRQMARRSRTQVVFGFTELLNGYFYNCAVLVGGGRQYHRQVPQDASAELRPPFRPRPGSAGVRPGASPRRNRHLCRPKMARVPPHPPAQGGRDLPDAHLRHVGVRKRVVDADAFRRKPDVHLFYASRRGV